MNVEARRGEITTLEMNGVEGDSLEGWNCDGYWNVGKITSKHGYHLLCLSLNFAAHFLGSLPFPTIMFPSLPSK